MMLALSNILCSYDKLSVFAPRSQDSVDASNPGNNLYVTGLSTRVTSSDLEKYFNKEGKVRFCLCKFYYFL